MSEGIHLFSNGTEFEWWHEKNCGSCVKEPTCELYNALFTDSLTHGLPSGNVTAETAEALGYRPEYLGVLDWPCKARQTETPQPSGAREMAEAGAAMLPGFGGCA